MPKLVVQLVTWNGAQYLPHLFRSLAEQTLQDWDFVVVDNGSTDGTVAAIEQALDDLSQFRTKLRKEFRCQFVRNAENCGFAGGHNQAFALSESDYVQLLNQDAILAPEYLARAAAALDADSGLAAAQGRILRWAFAQGPTDGRTATIDTIGLRVLRNRRVVEWGAGVAWAPDAPGITAPFEVFGISGALPMLRRAAVLDVAEDGTMFDPTFVSYKEDVDLAFRLRWRGWRAAVVPTALAWHDRSAAAGEHGDRATAAAHRARPAHVRFLSYRNHWLLLLKHEGWGTLAWDWPSVAWVECKKLAYLAVADRATLRGLADVWRLRRAMREKRQRIMATAQITPQELHRWYG